MSVYKKVVEVIKETDFFNVVVRDKNGFGHVELESGDCLYLNDKSYLVGSAFDVKYASDCPLTNYNNAVNLGSEIYYINHKSVALSSSLTEKETDHVLVDFDSTYLYLGHVFKIVKIANSNLEFVEIKSSAFVN